MKNCESCRDLIQRLTRIEVWLTEMGVLSSRDHTPQCPADDPDGHGPCRCGAAQNDVYIKRIKGELQI